MDELQKMLSDCVGAVEANSFETMSLWKDHKETWDQGYNGVLKQIGDFHDLPVCISLTTNVVNGHKILFYYATSDTVSYSMIDEWLLKNMPDSAMLDCGRVNKVDAMNFHNLLQP